MNIFFSKSCLKYLAKCELKIRVILFEAIERLPGHGDIRPLKGKTVKNIYRLRVGKYRILFMKEEECIHILEIDTRGDIYK